MGLTNEEVKRSIPKVDPQNIPAELKSISRWVLWHVTKVKENGKFDKVPMHPKTRKNISALDPKNWMSFDTVMDAYEAGIGDGIGIVLSDDHRVTQDGRNSYLVALDFDNCTDDVEYVKNVWKQLGKTYKEVSPSGRGIRMFGLSEEPVRNHVTGKVEMYSNKRFMTVTGFWGQGDLKDITTLLPDLEEEWYGSETTANTSHELNSVPDHIAAFIEQHGSNIDKLFLTSDNEEVARIQSALAYIPADVYGIWRDIVWSILSSGLPEAEKIARDWSKTSDRYDDDGFDKIVISFDPSRSPTLGTLFHLAGRNGWQAEVVYSDCDDDPFDEIEETGFWKNIDEPRAKSNNPFDLANGQISISLDEPAPRDWILEGILLNKKSAVLAGFGGTSKTQLAIQLALAIARGTAFLDREVKAGSAMLALGEEDRPEIERRINAIGRHERWSEQTIEEVEERIKAFPLVGEDMRLSRKEGSSIKESKVVDRLIRAAKMIPDLRLIVIDHIGLAHGGDFNAREDAAFTMRLVNHIALQTGAAVLVLAHTPKSAMKDEKSDAAMVAGSTAFVDQARAAIVLATMREQEAKSFKIAEADRGRYASLSVVKSNYGPTGDVIWLHRISFDGIGLLEPAELRVPEPIDTQRDLDTRIVRLVAEKAGQLSRTKLRDAYSGQQREPLHASKAQVEQAIDRLLADGRLRNRPPTDGERKRFGLDHRTQHVLEVWPEEGEEAR